MIPLSCATSSLNRGFHVASTLWPSVFVLYAEGAHRTVRERDALRIPLHRARYSTTLGRVAAALAAGEVPAAGGWRAQLRRDEHHHRVPAACSSRPRAPAACGSYGRVG